MPDFSLDDAPAIFSDDRVHRYALRRRVGLGDKRCVFVMLNPSTADEQQDDPTIRRCIGFAKSSECGILEVVNIFAFRSTSPKNLKTALDPIGAENDYYINLAASKSDVLIVAWGNNGSLYNRGRDVLEMVKDCVPCVLEWTDEGQPGHPLYIPKNTEPMAINFEGI